MLENLLVDLKDFLIDYLPLLNSHNVDYLLKDHWQTYVRAELRGESVDFYDLFEKRMIARKEAENAAEELIDRFVEFHRRIEGVTTKKEEIEARKSFKYPKRTFMSLKKEHEVDILAPLIYQIAQISDCQSIIDFGSGRGYLGVQLAYDYNLPVLGIELSESTVHSGAERQQLLLKYQKAYSDNRNYQTTSTLITPSTDFEQLFSRTFDFPSSSFLLCGLHACGSLSSSLISHYLEKSHVHALINVACCYHLLEEKFSANPFTHRTDELNPYSFPLSRVLIEQRMPLGRNARMLAVQSFERNKLDRSLNASLWYRAVFQVILVEVYERREETKLGKMKKKNVTFEEYVWRAIEKLNLEKSKINSELIESYRTRFASQEQQLYSFVQLKVLFAYLIELLILLDRLLFLRQSIPTAHSSLVPLFDPIKSPRRWCLISYK